MYKAGEVSVYRTCCERATQPYSLGGGGTIYPDSRPAGVTARSQIMVTECLLTRSILIKMYSPLKDACLYIVFTVNQKHAEAQADLSLRWAHTHFVGFVKSWLI